MPWSNVLANEEFGSLVTERGSMCTWSLNSRENQLTAWSNDAICDPSGEAFYLLEEGELWSPASQPIRREGAQYEVVHGQGYSRFDGSFRRTGHQPDGVRDRGRSGEGLQVECHEPVRAATAASR